MSERSSVAELAHSLRAELNRYSPGGKLPSSRALVERYRVSPVTVTRALAQLAAEGLVVTRPGAGAFLLVGRVPLPERRHWAGLAVVAGGVVIGFPLLTTLALQTS
ncbi:winged helix-turn-helix domain-containing protein, partial [Streptomyces venezuelae]|uniref:winged helix-turn-helix domain-containing protein n=1 Tax=Streptomyces venezuelae TaxID=54571 RepID=UPI001F3B7226